MKDWNVVASVREGEFSHGRKLLEQFGQTEKTGFFNILVLWTPEPAGLLDSLAELARQDPDALKSLARVIPVFHTFTFQSPGEFEAKACAAARGHLPMLDAGSFHVRMRRRGFKGRLSSMNEEQFLDHYLLAELEQQGSQGRITFDDPDVIIALETVGAQAGLSAWTREQLHRYPLLHLD